MREFRRSESIASRRELQVVMRSSSDNKTPVSGETVSATIVKPGGSSFAAISGSVAEIGSTGVYKVSLAAGDLDTVGQSMLKCSGSASVNDEYVPIEVVSDPVPYDAQHLYGPKKSASFTAVIELRDPETGAPLVDPTIAAGDFKVATTGAGFSNPTTLPSVSPAGSSRVLVQLSAAEMASDQVIVHWADQTSPPAWLPGQLVIYTRSVTVDELVRATVPANTLDVASTGEAGIDLTNIKQAAAPTTLSNITVPTVSAVTQVNGLADGVITAAKLASNAITAAKVAADVIDEIWDEPAGAHAIEGTTGEVLSGEIPNILDWLGTFEGEDAGNANTVKGYLLAMALASASTPTDLSGFDQSTDSLERIGHEAAHIGRSGSETIRQTLDDIETAVGTLAENVYFVELALCVDEASSTDEYTLIFLENDREMPNSEFSAVFVTAFRRSDGTQMFSSKSGTPVGSHAFKFSATGGERLPAGDTAILYISASGSGFGGINAQKLVTRDTTA